MHQSIATIASPEFINLQPLDINPLISACEIKVLYVGQNRNRSYITKEVATEMSKTLRGSPIVGMFKESTEDFGDHGEQIVLDDEGVHFNCLTKPYGFVSPDAKVWFQDFEDIDDFGNSVVRTYLMTTGYLWTGQYEECKVVTEEGRPHSMELDEDSLKGYWSTDNKTGMDFFIINDAIFSKLCILGDAVEPCFEGSSVTAPNVSKDFTLDKEFTQTLYSMMQELKNYVMKGGTSMDNQVNETVVNTEMSLNNAEGAESAVETVVEENAATETSTAYTEEVVIDAETETESVETTETESVEAEYTEEAAENNEEVVEEEAVDYEAKYTALAANYTDLEQKYNALVKENATLVAYKNSIEDAEKDKLINSFYMLSDEDKKEVIENKSKYSLEEIKAKLSVIYVEKKVNFDLDIQEKNQETIEDNSSSVVTYTLDAGAEDAVPAYIQALRNSRK